jgi:hypothetical protein
MTAARIRKIAALARRASTPGERQAAEAALGRLQGRARQERAERQKILLSMVTFCLGRHDRDDLYSSIEIAFLTDLEHSRASPFFEYDRRVQKGEAKWIALVAMVMVAAFWIRSPNVRQAIAPEPPPPPVAALPQPPPWTAPPHPDRRLEAAPPGWERFRRSNRIEDRRMNGATP